MAKGNVTIFGVELELITNESVIAIVEREASPTGLKFSVTSLASVPPPERPVPALTERDDVTNPVAVLAIFSSVTRLSVPPWTIQAYSLPSTEAATVKLRRGVLAI